MNTLINTISIIAAITTGLYLINEYKKAGSFRGMFIIEEEIEEN